jgi:3-isopropylmalate dehydrogenase
MTSSYSITLLPGDGIGPEVVEAARQVLAAAAGIHQVDLRFDSHEAGAAYYQKRGVAIDADVMASLGNADAILLGAMGLPHVRKPDGTEITPQIDIREQHDLFASLRPCRLMAGVPTRSKAAAIDMLVIRETTEGLFAGRHNPRV